MTEMTRRLLLATAAAVPFAGWVRIADAAAPKDTAVFAKQIDDIITLDPGECYELSGSEMCTNIYDRLLRYEAEDLNKLVGGVAELLDRHRRRQDLHLQDPPEPEIPLRHPLTAEDVEFSLQRVILMDKTPAFLLTQLGWSKDNVKDLVKARAATRSTSRSPRISPPPSCST